ncbi:MAG TPA: hypothetical protein VLG50_03995 [Candidatus Saccharimonadales bacterium]|nr:hypothetical protein [Candidatus Saccharimonadales bacterium]
MKKNLKIIPVLFLTLCARLIPFNWIVGSFHATFSLSCMVAPVIAVHYGFTWISLFFLATSFFSTSWFVLFFLNRTPLLFASRAFAQREIITSFVVPFICMVLFIYQEMQTGAWVYSLYWLIPMALFFVKDSSYVRALSASFVAHSVGSVIWLYTHNMPAGAWIALIPIVACERLLIAGGILVFDYAITYFRQLELKLLLAVPGIAKGDAWVIPDVIQPSYVLNPHAARPECSALAECIEGCLNFGGQIRYPALKKSFSESLKGKA